MHDRSGETIRKHVYVRLREGKRLKMIVLNVAFWNSFCVYRNLDASNHELLCGS